MTAFMVSTLTPHLGAQVEGLDLSQPLDAPQLHDLHQAFADWGVLVFRNQHLDREAHKAFGRYFGDLHVHPMNYSRKSDPEILIVKTTKDSPYTAGDAWHTDVTCDAIPPLASALYITETPEVGGGDTLFADMYLAYELSITGNAAVPRGPHCRPRWWRALCRRLRINASRGWVSTK